jgi:hypothetical protein
MHQTWVLVAAVVVAALEGLVASAAALRGDDERMDALVGRTIMAIGLGVVCFVVATLLSDEEDRQSSAD